MFNLQYMFQIDVYSRKYPGETRKMEYVQKLLLKKCGQTDQKYLQIETLWLLCMTYN